MRSVLERLKQTPMTAALIMSFVLLFVLQFLIDLISPAPGALLRWTGNNWVLTVSDEEPWRLLSSAFVHIGFEHLIFNTVAMFVLGPAVETILGRWRLLALFVLAAIGGGLLSSYVGYIQRNVNLSVGASGGIMGMAAALPVLALCKIKLHGLPFNTQALLTLLVINLLYGFLVPGVDNAAHIGGALTGALIALFYFIARYHHRMWFDWVMMVLLALGFAALWVKWHDWLCFTAECIIWH